MAVAIGGGGGAAAAARIARMLVPRTTVSCVARNQHRSRYGTVAESLVRFTAINDEGRRFEVAALPGRKLSGVLASSVSSDRFVRSLREGWDAHVTIAREWLEKMPARTPEEEAKLEEMAEDVTTSSRVASFVKLSPELAGMVVTMAKVRQWRTL